MDPLTDTIQATIAMLQDIHDRESTSSFHGKRVRSDIEDLLPHLFKLIGPNGKALDCDGLLWAKSD